MVNKQQMPKWLKRRILAFFNRANNVEDILDGTIKDDPSDGPGRTIGRKLAARILRRRNEIRPFRRFMEWEQLDDIPGIGEGTIKDLAYTFGTNAAAAFRAHMYNETVIYEANWTLEFFRIAFDDEASFNEVVYDEAAFRVWMCDQIARISQEREVEEAGKNQMLDNISNTYIDVYHNGTPAPAYALALWFYEFDADNWFSWERIQQASATYFDHHSGAYPWEMELRLFKGFVQKGIIPQGITPHDLPVVVNWPEKAITIWASALYD